MGIFAAKGLMGGKDGDAPEQKSATETYLDQFDALDQGYGKLLPTTKKYEPQFLQQQLDMSKQFAPQFAQLERSTLEQVNPEAFGALKGLSSALNSRGDLTSLDISPELSNALKQDLRGSQAARGMLGSPISALTEAQATLGQRIQERDKWLNVAGALAGRAPSVSQPQVSTSGFGSLGTPQISALTSLQAHANQLAFDRWDKENAARASKYEGFGTMLNGMDFGKIGSQFGSLFGPTSVSGNDFGMPTETYGGSAFAPANGNTYTTFN